jgi:hypothetical protein
MNLSKLLNSSRRGPARRALGNKKKNIAVMQLFDFIRIFWHANHMGAARVNSDLSPVKRKNLNDKIAVSAIRQNYPDRVKQ